MTKLALEPIYGSLWMALAAAAILVTAIALVTPPTQNASHRRWIIALRSAAAIILMLIVFRPALLRTDSRPADAALVVAVDSSRSMTLPDGDGRSRWETQTSAWQTLSRGLVDVDETLSLRLLAYDETAKKLSSVQPDALESLSPEGELTDLSAAALASIQAAEGQPIAGVVLMGDGTQTAPVAGTGAQRVVETMRSLGIPLWTVPIGPAGGASASRDAAVDSLPETFQMFSGNEVEIPFQVLLRGLSGVDVPVRISWIDDDGQTREVASRTVSATQANDVVAVTVPVKAPEPGTYRLQVQADQQQGELVTTNNSQVAFVDVREGGGRILYLGGSPRLEQLFLRRSLTRFPDLELRYRWLPADERNRWPIDLGNQLQPGNFDIYILADLPAAALGESQLRQLAETVSEGAGLVMLGGSHSFGPGGYADSPLADVLPVKMQASSGDDQIEGPLEIQLARNHPITEIGGDDPAQQWRELPALLGANRLAGPKVAPGVQVLLETEQQQPLLIVGQFGRGRVAATAMDSTWRWWRGGQSEAHRRFWRQLVLWLLSREETGGDRIVIEMDARRFAVNEPPEFRAEVQSLEQDVANNSSLVAEIVRPSGEVMPLETITQSSGAATAQTFPEIRGEIPRLEPGIYRLRVRAADENSPLEAEDVSFQVIDESRELAQPMADPVYLRQLANLTSEYGGAPFSADELDQLIQTIRERRQQAEIPVVDKFRLGDGPASGWLLFLIFTGALSTEWFLRKQWGLV